MVAGQMVANTKVPEGSWNSETVCVTPWIQTWHWPLSHWEQKPEPGHRPTGGPKVTFPTHFLGILLHSSHIGHEFLQSHQGHAYLPRGLCTGCSLCLEHSSSKYPNGSLSLDHTIIKLSYLLLLPPGPPGSTCPCCHFFNHLLT